MRLGQRALPSTVEILDGTDVDDVWERFEIFEALHNGMRICNPLTETEFDEVVEAVASTGGASMLDVACGYGELLARCASRTRIEGVGIDLSPWMAQTAALRTDELAAESSLRWVLGEAREYGKDRAWDVVSCMGAEWIWHGFNGTARAVAERLRPGGLAIIGAARLKDGCDPAHVSASHGRLESLVEEEAILASHGLSTIWRLDPDDAAWDAYLARTATSIAQWAAEVPGGRTAEYVAAQQEWIDARERDREVMGWSAWVATATG